MRSSLVYLISYFAAGDSLRSNTPHMYEIALAPLRQKVRINSEFSSTVLEHLYLYIKSEDDLKRLAARYPSPQEFFKALESTYISKLLSGVRIKIQKHNVDQPLTFQDLSEGEQQLLIRGSGHNHCC